MEKGINVKGITVGDAMSVKGHFKRIITQSLIPQPTLTKT